MKKFIIYASVLFILLGCSVQEDEHEIEIPKTIENKYFIDVNYEVIDSEIMLIGISDQKNPYVVKAMTLGLLTDEQYDSIAYLKYSGFEAAKLIYPGCYKLFKDELQDVDFIMSMDLDFNSYPQDFEKDSFKYTEESLQKELLENRGSVYFHLIVEKSQDVSHFGLYMVLSKIYDQILQGNDDLVMSLFYSFVDDVEDYRNTMIHFDNMKFDECITYERKW